MKEQIKDKMWCVYIHTNKINNKVYIGIAKGNPKKRWKNGNGYREEKQPVFARAIKKYTWDGFNHIIFDEGLTKEEAKRIEILLIALYKSNCKKYYNPSYGYNMTDGGDWNPMIGKQLTDDQKNKISESLKKLFEDPERRKARSEAQKGKRLGPDNPMYGKVVSEETRQKIGDKSRELWKNEEYRKSQLEHLQGEKNPFYGKHHSEETKKIISDKAKERHALNGPSPNRYMRTVVQLSLNMNFIAEFPSQKIASKITGVNKGNISNCCNGRYKSAGGYKWMFKEDWDELQLTIQNKLEDIDELQVI